MAAGWVDFKSVKAAVTLEMVLARYGITDLKRVGDELVGRCPIHRGDGARAFHASLTKQAFHCFSCKARGNVLDLCAALEGCTVREAALKLQAWFAVTEAGAAGTGGRTFTEPARKPQRGQHEEKLAEATVLANALLPFRLQGIDPAHEYLRGRGVGEKVAEQFGLGYFAGKGSMRGRIVIPIHNERGELVAYAGRTVDDSDEERYRFPKGFRKSLELYNLHRALEHGSGTVVVVEGFFGCVRVAEAGCPCVALMGSSMSSEQEALLVSRFKHAVLLFDGDEAGTLCANECLNRLGRRMWVRAVDLAEGQQPDSLAAGQVGELLLSCEPR